MRNMIAVLALAASIAVGIYFFGGVFSQNGGVTPAPAPLPPRFREKPVRKTVHNCWTMFAMTIPAPVNRSRPPSNKMPPIISSAFKMNYRSFKASMPETMSVI